MKAWRLERLGGTLGLKDVPTPEPRPGSVLVRIEASALMSYLKPYVAGKLPLYNPPPGPFTPGTNGVGVVAAVGRDVWHLKPGQRVVLSSHFVARDNVEDPAQILIGLTAGEGAAPVLADWPDGTLAEYALMPVEAVTPAEGLDHLDAAQLAAVGRCIIPHCRRVAGDRHGCGPRDCRRTQSDGVGSGIARGRSARCNGGADGRRQG